MSLLRHSLWGFAGSALPAVLAIPSAGLIGRALGAERFGLFLLLVALTALAGVLDLGVPRALSRLAARPGITPLQLGQLLGTGMAAASLCALPALAAAGCLGAAFASLVHPSPVYRTELGAALPVAGLLVAVQLPTAVTLAAYEGRQRFRRLALAKIAAGVLAALLPAAHVLAATESATLGSVLLALLVARTAGLLVLLGSLLSGQSIPLSALRWRTPMALEMFSFGGWVAISNLISPLMNHADRFLLSSFLGARTAAAYLTASDLVGRAAPVPAAIAASLFPRLCAQPDDRAIARRALQLMLAACGAICALLWGFDDTILRLWLGDAYLPASAALLDILLIGFLLNALAHVPFARLQAAGHSRATALLHAAECLPFLGLLAASVQLDGPRGAAWAWVARMALDLAALLMIERRLSRPVAPAALQAPAGG